MTSPRISRSRSLRGALRTFLGAVAFLAPAACDGRPSVSTTDSAFGLGDLPGTDSVATVVASGGWDSGAGPFIVLPTVDGGLMAGSLLRPDVTELTVGDTSGIGAASADGRLELFARGGKVGEARLVVEGAPQVDDGCTAWPVARLGVDADVNVSPWTAAIVRGRVTAIPLDSIEGLAPRDSARLAADLTRLASGLADDTTVTFRGLPFVVLRAWRTRGLDTAFVVATLARRVNQEDDPKEERLVMVVDGSGDSAKEWVVGWHERAAGHEEELVVAEPLLAFRMVSAPDVRLLFGRDDGVALGAAVLSRRADGWRVLWESAVLGCN
jgi:hypothetical protein